MSATPARRKRPDWRSREVRASQKMVARRVSEDDHQALKRFAEAHDTKIAELIAPAIQELIERARAFCQALDEPTVTPTRETTTNRRRTP